MSLIPSKRTVAVHHYTCGVLDALQARSNGACILTSVCFRSKDRLYAQQSRQTHLSSVSSPIYVRYIGGVRNSRGRGDVLLFDLRLAGRTVCGTPRLAPQLGSETQTEECVVIAQPWRLTHSGYIVLSALRPKEKTQNLTRGCLWTATQSTKVCSLQHRTLPLPILPLKRRWGKGEKRLRTRCGNCLFAISPREACGSRSLARTRF
jgi:hypothetical protein